MKLRAFAPSSQLWCGGRVFSEVLASNEILRRMPSSSHRWIWHLEIPEPKDPIQTAIQGLEDLSNGLLVSSSFTDNTNDNTNNGTTTMTPPQLVVLQPNGVSTQEDSLAYLREILPVGAQFLERHSSIGTGLGRTNAHGKPLDTHVAGICHSFPSTAASSQNNSSIAQLAQLLDVYLPTRLALSASHFNNNDNIDEDDWEAVMENTDLILFRNNKEDNNDAAVVDRWKRIWKSQQQNDCQETFALCANSQIALQLGAIFEEFCYSNSEP